MDRLYTSDELGALARLHAAQEGDEIDEADGEALADIAFRTVSPGPSVPLDEARWTLHVIRGVDLWVSILETKHTGYSSYTKERYSDWAAPKLEWGNI